MNGNRVAPLRHTGGIMDLAANLRLVAIPPPMQFFLASLATMLALALLDFVGAVLAKEWADKGHPAWFVLGLLTFAILFTLYAHSLQTAELSLVTIGWVVFLQVGLVLYERFRYGASLSPAKWAAILIILALQAYLVLVPNEQGGSETAVVPASGEVSSGSAPTRE